MVVDVNTDFLINKKITADQYIMMSLVLAGKQNILRDYSLATNMSVGKICEDIRSLQEKGLIEGSASGTYDFMDLRPTSQLKSMFDSDDFFKELLETFPLKVTRTDGTLDYLRTDQTKAKLLYLAYTRGKKSVHDHILKCLKYEVAQREANGSLKFMKRIASWISSKGWESYENQVDDLSNNTPKIEQGYGTELI